MKIQLSIRREPDGSKVELGGQTYHFKPENDDPNGPHVAEVTEPAHIDRLLSIPEYTRYEAKKAKGSETGDDTTVPPPLNSDGTEQTGLAGDSPVFDTGILSYPNTPNTDENADVQKLDAELKQEHERQAEGEGGTQKDQERKDDNPPSEITAVAEDEKDGKDEKARKTASKAPAKKAAAKSAK